MANSLSKTKRRIASIKSTKKITEAMEMVASVKLKRHRFAYEASKVYFDELKSIMALSFDYDSKAKSHYAKENENIDRNLYIVITSDLGLCAGYNNEIYKFLNSLLKEGDVISPIGNKGINHYQRIENPSFILDFSFSSFGLSTGIESLRNMVDIIKDSFNKGSYKNIYLVSTRYINSLTFEPMITKLLPIELNRERDIEEDYCPPKFEPEPRVLIHSLLKQYLYALLKEKMEESQYAEQASRRNAMENANDNADELIDKLSIEYNKARQGAITQEITEVVAGANAAT